MIEAELARGSYDAVAVDNRLMFYALTYYGMEESAPLFMWRYEPSISNHAELTKGLPEDDKRVLLVSYYFETYEPYFEADFASVTALGREDIELGGGKVRRLKLFETQGYDGPRMRPPRD